MSENIQFAIDGATLHIPKHQLLQRWLATQLETGIRTSSATLITTESQRIGQVWPGQGGIYAGIVRGDEGQPDYHLIVHAEDKPDIKWNDAMAWAKGIAQDGHNDYALPQRKEQAVLFGNVPDLFQKTWYWSGAQYAANASYAWLQFFSYGSQTSLRKTSEGRARAVRRILIIE